MYVVCRLSPILGQSDLGSIPPLYCDVGEIHCDCDTIGQKVQRKHSHKCVLVSHLQSTTVLSLVL
jgi:hypothetical protein